MEINFLEWFGYVASFLVLVSLTMSSIIKLRWINLIGGVLFATYGFKIGSIPTGFMNVGIAAIDIYYLYKIYTTKENLKLVKAEKNSNYFNYLYEKNKQDIIKYSSDKILEKLEIVFYMLRDDNTAGILAGRTTENGKTFFIDIDYVTPQYRDFKFGNYLFNKNTEILKEKGYTKLQTSSSDETHTKYLLKMGFEKTSNNLFQKVI